MYSFNDDVSSPLFSTTTVRGLAEGYSLLLGVDPELALYVVEGESGYDYLNKGDLDLICNLKGSKNVNKPVRAKGVLQITDCYFPEVTDEQAFDPHWSFKNFLPFMKDKRTCMRIWTLCRKYYTRSLLTTS